MSNRGLNSVLGIEALAGPTTCSSLRLLGVNHGKKRAAEPKLNRPLSLGAHRRMFCAMSM
jgi:hypothetical protein